jgi:acetylornithine deacetylase/succinyl-diaminopimelate desuccinylase-like protein
VTIGHRGLQRYIVEVSGESVHSGSERWNNGTEGANAVAALSEIVLAIEREKWPEDRNENFGELTLKVTPGTVFNGGSFESIVPSKAQ